jgi:hypothetical protein
MALVVLKHRRAVLAMRCGEKVSSLTPEPFCWRLQIPLGSPLAPAKEEVFPRCSRQVGLLRRKNPLLNQLLWLVAGLTTRSASQAALHRDCVQTNILDRGPDNRQATGFRRKDVDLIGALAHITKEAFNSIGGSNVPVHPLRKGIKGQEVLFVFNQASHRFPDSVEHTWL